MKEAAGSRETNPAGSSVLARAAALSPRTYVWVAMAVLFMFLSVSPVSRNIDATSRLNRARAELAEQKSVTESLEREVNEAESLEYIEREARRQRLVAPGEVLYLITTDDDQEIEIRVKAIQSMDEAWERVRGMLHSGTESTRTGP